jgi:LDH2 family malate/lactate/ureidoglycolate dehydrogenase
VSLNVESFQPLSAFEARIESYIASLKDVPLAAGHSQIYFPGEMEDLADLENRASGLLLPEDTLASLVRVAKLAGLESSLPF